MEIFSSKEESKLSNSELIKYYRSLREYLLSTPHQNLSAGSLSFCEKINPAVREILKRCCGYEIIESGNENIEGLCGIYAHTHQSRLDHINFIATNPNHTILMNSIVLSELYKMILRINGVVFVDKQSKESKQQAKLEMIRLLLNYRPITMFPESAWNCSPNKLHLPLYNGIVDIAKKSGRPIIPVVQEYVYDESKMDEIERIDKVFVQYGKPIYVSETDSLSEKLEEFSEAICTMRWNLMEEKGMFHREDLNNFQYMNYLAGIIRNLKNAGIDIEVERQGLYGAKDEFYLFHYLNAVDYDENGQYLDPPYVRKLIQLHK